MKYLTLVLVISVVCGALGHSLPKEEKRTRKPVLLISLDGLRADKLDIFLRENPYSNIQKLFVEQGMKAEYMTPSFPSLTFPNHFTLVTGQYPENTGITGNKIYDPDYNTIVNLISGRNSKEPQWWNKTDPIWLTANDQGLKTSSFFWVGSEIWGRHPDFFMAYNNAFLFKDRCSEVVKWFKKFEMDFVTLYFNEPDHIGHDKGADSVEYMNKIKEMDEVLGFLFKEMEEANLKDKINVLLVSDHGMTDMKETIMIANYIDLKLIDQKKSFYGTSSLIYPLNAAAESKLMSDLQKIPHMRVFFKDDVPEYLNFNSGPRIAPIVVISDEGYTLHTQKQTLHSNHGFDIAYPSMRAVALARGPDFKQNIVIAPIKNVDIYPLMCELLQITCAKRDGTIEPFVPALNN